MRPLEAGIDHAGHVQIRARRQADVDALLDMAHLVKRLDGYPPRGPVDLERFMVPPEQLAAWVAEIDSTVVGHVALHATGANDTVHLASRHTGKAPEDLAVVARVLVSPTTRRIGVGHALLETAVHGAHERGQQPILEVAVHFDAAIGLYESSGWSRVGEVTIQFGDEPSLQRYVYVGPTPTEEAGAAITRR
jgi:ribosomal protein S18 acetylase RimI-like enzyme